MIGHPLKICTDDAGPEQSLVLFVWYAYMYEPVHVHDLLFLIACAHMLLLNIHADVASKGRCLYFNLSLYLHSTL